MSDDTCGRCGGLRTGAEGMCDECLGWLRGQRDLSDEEVVDAVQFSASPVNSPDHIVLVIGSVALPLLLSLSGITVMLIDAYGDQSTQAGSNAPMGAVFVAFLVVLVTLGAVFCCAWLARRRPLGAGLVALGVTTAMTVPLSILAGMELPQVTIMFVRAKGASFTLEDVLGLLLFMQVLGVVILLSGVVMAANRRRRISSARTRLNAWAQRR